MEAKGRGRGGRGGVGAGAFYRTLAFTIGIEICS